MSLREWVRLADLALERESSAICVDSVSRARHWFNTVLPAAFVNHPRFEEAKGRETTAAYLSARPKVQALLDDLKAVPTWSGRLRLLGEHLFPGEAYMREVYAPWSRQPLPVLYVVRVLKGMVSWFR